MMDSAVEVQTALVAVLRATAIVADLLGSTSVAGHATPGVFDVVPTKAVLPYIAVGETQVLADEAEGIPGSANLATLHIWSDKPTFVEAKRIAAAARETLHEAELSISGHHLVEIRWEESRFIDDIGGVLRHGIMTFRVTTEPA